MNHGPDEAGGGASAPGPILRPFMAPSPIPITNRDRANRLEFDNWRADLVTVIVRDQNRRNRPFNFETNHAIMHDRMRASRRHRLDQRMQRLEAEFAEHPPAAQPGEDDPPVTFGGVAMNLAGDALIQHQGHDMTIPLEVYGVDPDNADPDDQSDLSMEEGAN